MPNKSARTAILLSCTIALCFGATATQPGNTTEDHARETVLDRIVHIEAELIPVVPDVPRRNEAMADLESTRVNIGDGHLFCLRQGRGLPLVLVHGGPGATHHYFLLSFPEAKEFAQIIYYDQRGCGDSDYAPGTGYTVRQAVDDLENLRKALKIDRWVVLGHSYGGLLAQVYAVEYPDHLAGLVLVCASPAMAGPVNDAQSNPYLTSNEQQRIEEIRRSPNLSTEQIIYNRMMNGDWKRQHFLKPSPERMAQMALYEWKHDLDFNRTVSSDARQIDLRGAFSRCPIPTLIIEGQYDLTFAADKPARLQENHPQARMMLFEQSAHNPFDDEPEDFFFLLRDFVTEVEKHPAPDLAEWKKQLAEWRNQRATSLAGIAASVGWGQASGEKVVAAYTPEQLADLDDPTLVMKVGFALYDFERYAEALKVFQKLEALAGNNTAGSAVALIWQGHVLDLLDRREEAKDVYRKVVDLNVTGAMRHDQYGLSYVPSRYAAERLEKPFVHMENLQEPIVAVSPPVEPTPAPPPAPVNEASEVKPKQEEEAKQEEQAYTTTIVPTEKVTQAPLLPEPVSPPPPSIETISKSETESTSIAADTFGPENDKTETSREPAAESSTQPTDVPSVQKTTTLPATDPFHLGQAAGRGDLAEVRKLLDQGLDINQRNESEQRTPLHEAASGGYLEIATLLVDHGAKVNLLDRHDQTPLHVAAKNGHAGMVKYLGRKALLNPQDAQGQTPLHQAAMSGHTETVTALIDAGVKINVPDAEGRGALHLAAADGHDATVEVLAAKAMLNMPDKRGMTPLHEAAAGGHLQVVKILIQRGALPAPRNADGATPLALAEQRKHTAIVDFLRQHAN